MDPIEDSVPVLLTDGHADDPHGYDGLAHEDRGIVLDIKTMKWPDVLSHELGHVAGYVGDAPGDRYHSKDPYNLMHLPKTSAETQLNLSPDCQWCRRVAALAR